MATFENFSAERAGEKIVYIPRGKTENGIGQINGRVYDSQSGKWIDAVPTVNPLMEAAKADPFLQSFDWVKNPDNARLTEEQVGQLEG